MREDPKVVDAEEEMEASGSALPSMVAMLSVPSPPAVDDSVVALFDNPPLLFKLDMAHFTTRRTSRTFFAVHVTVLSYCFLAPFHF